MKIEEAEEFLKEMLEKIPDSQPLQSELDKLHKNMKLLEDF